MEQQFKNRSALLIMKYCIHDHFMHVHFGKYMLLCASVCVHYVLVCMCACVYVCIQANVIMYYVYTRRHMRTCNMCVFVCMSVYMCMCM